MSGVGADFPINNLLALHLVAHRLITENTRNFGALRHVVELTDEKQVYYNGSIGVLVISCATNADGMHDCSVNAPKYE